MMYMNISAMTLEEAEIMLRVLDKWLRHFYNVDGVQRETSFNRRANYGIRAQIRVKVDPAMWNRVKDGVMSESLRRLGKGISFHAERISDEFRVLELATAEATI